MLFRSPLGRNYFDLLEEEKCLRNLNLQERVPYKDKTGQDQTITLLEALSFDGRSWNDWMLNFDADHFLNYFVDEFGEWIESNISELAEKNSDNVNSHGNIHYVNNVNIHNDNMFFCHYRAAKIMTGLYDDDILYFNYKNEIVINDL